MPLMAIINPEIEVVTREVVEDWEGCLSIPDIRGRVPRARQISVRAYDRIGQEDRDPGLRLHRTRHPARNRSSRRRPLLRSHEDVPVADVPGRVRALLDGTQGRLTSRVSGCHGFGIAEFRPEGGAQALRFRLKATLAPLAPWHPLAPCSFPLAFERPLRVQPLELHRRVIDELHRRPRSRGARRGRR